MKIVNEICYETVLTIATCLTVILTTSIYPIVTLM